MIAPDFDMEAYVKQAAALGGYTITPQQLPGVLDNMRRIAGTAQLFLEFPLPDDLEIAATFAP
ncbi:DUF4089 domain-containing protein [Ferrovibrio sp.]|uniref:DUF4089 domain-containing protein n=1 Tax=Ferrovibrio sp. TaxID=1917215 RepID=UPI001B47DAF6|nr:DUF4089 domain-containing protein [Ferrovibrio sp.]MBP7065658.1 DUF4089 domain-containing protein [Ferrovibrio sp.]